MRSARSGLAAHLASRLASVLAVVAGAGLVAAVLSTAPAAAQSGNIDTVAGPGPAEESTLSRIPRRVNDDVSMRAVGVTGPDSTRWALSVIGGDDVESFAFRVAGDTVTPIRVERPDGAGPTSVYLKMRDFLTLSRTKGAKILLDGTEVPLPAPLRQDMKAVYEEVV
jgi:hypothetical protein